MDTKTISLKIAVKDLYKSFEESLREAFVAIISQPKTSGTSAYLYQFETRCLELSERYFFLIDTITYLSEENSSSEELERFSKLVKSYIEEDIQNMKRMIKTFVIRASNGSRLGLNVGNFKAEVFVVLQDSIQYKLKSLGRSFERIL